MSSSLTTPRPFSLTYASGSTSRAKISSNTVFATVRLMVPFSTIWISPARWAGEKRISSASISRSFNRRMASTMSQLEASLGRPQSAAVSSNTSAICLELVSSPAS